MKRMVGKCTPEFRKRTGCDMVEDGNTCEYCTPKGYCGYYKTMNSKGEKQLFKQFDRLGQLEDEAEEREKGCSFCSELPDEGCYGIVITTHESPSPVKYCPQCGKKLV